MVRSVTSAATAGSPYVARSITAQPRHHDAPIDSSTGLRSRAAREKASALQSVHAMPPGVDTSGELDMRVFARETRPDQAGALRASHYNGR